MQFPSARKKCAVDGIWEHNERRGPRRGPHSRDSSNRFVVGSLKPSPSLCCKLRCTFYVRHLKPPMARFHEHVFYAVSCLGEASFVLTTQVPSPHKQTRAANLWNLGQHGYERWQHSFRPNKVQRQHQMLAPMALWWEYTSNFAALERRETHMWSNYLLIWINNCQC